MYTQGHTNLVLETSSLTKYYGKARGIIDIDLEIHPGEVFGFIGPNGAGKSTTLRVLLGLIFPTSGSGQIFGMDIVSQSKAIKQHVGFMPSDVNYYPHLSIGELLSYSARFYGQPDQQRITRLSRLFNLDLKRRFRDLSLGNRKKVSILQALLHKPDLLILDEPTSGLDPLMQKRFFELLEEENNRGVTIFLSSHTLSDVQKVCGRVAIIKEGRIIKIEDVKSLRSKQLKKVRLEFPRAVRETDLAVSGVNSLEVHDNTAVFLYSGDINALVKFLAARQLSNIIIAEPELEEIFMHYYAEQQEEKQ